jgi:hypothetical protein
VPAQDRLAPSPVLLVLFHRVGREVVRCERGKREQQREKGGNRERHGGARNEFAK